MTPRTAAGRALLASFVKGTTDLAFYEDDLSSRLAGEPTTLERVRSAILAIEAEAAASPSGLRAAAQAVADTSPGNAGFIEKWQALRAALAAAPEQVQP